MIENGMHDPLMKMRMEELKIERTRLASYLARPPEPPMLRLHPGLAESYRAKVADLASALSDPEIQLQASETSRGLILEMRLVPDAGAQDGLHIELVGDLSSILSLQEGGKQKARGLRGAVPVLMLTCNRYWLRGPALDTVSFRHRKMTLAAVGSEYGQGAGSNAYTPAPLARPPRHVGRKQ
ncbi:hypothetical protein [Rhodovulum sulfidophilum]|uniref:hypothetical protein n=1 Tax=Rhodovulum sulfidophilum TaxID=35806 RepID=UPI001F374398|nr:hypothetical protein [Rhodovulum sulfidophilum]MCE8438555.1 hypothetical protein [Rhodovulum sulfidophilum]